VIAAVQLRSTMVESSPSDLPRRTPDNPRLPNLH
jgi:hypothetical protein